MWHHTHFNKYKNRNKKFKKIYTDSARDRDKN